MNQIAQNTVDETVPVSTLEANTTETKTKSEETHTDARNKRFLAFSVWIAQKNFLHHCPTRRTA
jgi:hypothetical protein